MYRTSIILLTASLLLLASCREPVVRGTGSMKTESRATTDSFDFIESEMPVDADIRVVPGSTATVQLTGYSNLLSNVLVKVEGNKLRITTRKDVHLYTDKNLKATITLPLLAGISIIGNSHAAVTGTVTGEKLDLELAGSGDIVIDSVNVGDLSAEIAGSGSMTIKSGMVNKGSYEISGSGDIHAQELSHAAVDIDIAGSGNAAITATQQLNIEIAGSGNVKYKGHPAITEDIAGSGNITDAN